jgi:hypothetical protein
MQFSFNLFEKGYYNYVHLSLYNTLALPVLLYGSKTWTVKARDASRITAAEMKYLRRTAGYNGTDCKTNTQIAKELTLSARHPFQNFSTPCI